MGKCLQNDQIEICIFKNKDFLALAGVAQWIEYWPLNQRVISSIPIQGHMPGLQARSPLEGKWEANTC